MTSSDENNDPMARRECEILPLRVRRMTNPILDRAAQGRIGQQLRAMYERLTLEPIPERLTALLNRLDRRDPGDGE